MTLPEDMRKPGSKKPTAANVVDLEHHTTSSSAKKSECMIIPHHQVKPSVAAPSDSVHASKVSSLASVTGTLAHPAIMQAVADYHAKASIAVPAKVTTKSTDALKLALVNTKMMVPITKQKLASTKPNATAPAVKDAIQHKKVVDTIKQIATKTGDKQIAEDADKTSHECDAMLIKYVNPKILGEKLVKTNKHDCAGFTTINEDLMVAKCPVLADGTCPTQLHAECTWHTIKVDDMWNDIKGGKSVLAVLGL